MRPEAWLQRIPAALDPTTRGWAVLVGGDGARMALGFVVGIVLARALGPTDFGVYVVLGAVSAIAGVLVDLGLSQAAVVRIAGIWDSDPTLARRRGQVFVWVRWSAASVLMLLALALAGWLAPAVGIPDEASDYRGSTLLSLALIGVVASALSGAVSTLFQAIGRFGWISALLVLNMTITLVLAVALWLGHRLDLMTAVVVLGILPSMMTFLVGRRGLGRAWSLRPPSPAAVGSELPRLARAGGWLWIGGLLIAVASRTDLLLVSSRCEPTAVGSYGLAFSLSASLGVLGASLYTVLLPAASALRDAAEVRSYLRRGLLRSAAATVALLPLLVLAHPFITVVYGREYGSAVPLFQLLIPVAALELLVMPLMLLVVPLRLPQWLAAAGGLRVVLVAAIGWVLVPVWGPTGAVAARAVALAASAVLLALVVAREGRRRWESSTGDSGTSGTGSGDDPPPGASSATL